MTGTELVIDGGKLSGQWRLADTAYGARGNPTVVSWARSYLRKLPRLPEPMPSGMLRKVGRECVARQINLLLEVGK